MRIDKQQIAAHNDKYLSRHQQRFGFAQTEIENTDAIIEKLAAFQVAIPSWALGTGGTRFGRFAGPGEPATLEQKLEDVGLLHALNQSSGAVSLYIPWFFPNNF